MEKFVQYPINSKEVISLGKSESYMTGNGGVWPFKRANDIVNGIPLKLSNMCGGFDFEFAGRTWRSSEQLYLCGEFTDPKIQEEIFNAKSGYAAKRFIKAKYKQQVREDFKEFRLQWMLFVVWLKCCGSEEFRKLLTSTPQDSILVEDTTTDNGGTAEIWGCSNKALSAIRKDEAARIKKMYSGKLSKKELEDTINLKINKIQNYGLWTGQNNIGKILMICRYCVLEKKIPDIDVELLKSKHIAIFGEEIDLSSIPNIF